jgi:glycine cleavage system H protein
VAQQKEFTNELWFEQADTMVTVGLTEDTAASVEVIHVIELPGEGELVDSHSPIGFLETDQGLIDLYSPANGVVSEVNPLVLEDPSLVIEDPSENWLFRIESDDLPQNLLKKSHHREDDFDDLRDELESEEDLDLEDDDLDDLDDLDHDDDDDLNDDLDDENLYENSEEDEEDFSPVKK